MEAKQIREGQFGDDAGHEFEIVEVSGMEVKIRYSSDGQTMWVQDNRIQETNEYVYQWELV